MQVSSECVALSWFFLQECLLGPMPCFEVIFSPNSFSWVLLAFQIDIYMPLLRCHIWCHLIFLELVDVPKSLLEHISAKVRILVFIFGYFIRILYFLPLNLYLRFYIFFGICPIALDYSSHLERRWPHPIRCQWRHCGLWSINYFKY